jgi:hypothetical protein
MTFEESPFEFTEAWSKLGVLTPARLAALRAEWARGEDGNTEHYRWRAFREFPAEHRPLPPALVVALHELGAQDRDQAMGSSMMDTLVRLPECPEARQ